jgi:hypothetical protein
MHGYWRQDYDQPQPGSWPAGWLRQPPEGDLTTHDGGDRCELLINMDLVECLTMIDLFEGDVGDLGQNLLRGGGPDEGGAFGVMR